MTAASTRAARLLQRWDRIGLGVRCAYNPALPSVIRHYLGAGRELVRVGIASEFQVQRRQLSVLLQTAADEALPMFWRSVCLEHTVMPQARLATLLRCRDPIAWHGVEGAVRAAWEQFAPGSASRSTECAARPPST